MSTTLTNGLKLPDKGSVDWYADMQNNYTILDGAVGTIAEHTTQIAGKANAVHTHTKSQITDFPAYGNTAGTICEGNDSRLSDARTPVAHTHGKADITDLFNSANTWSGENSFTAPCKTLGKKLLTDITDLDDAYYNGEVCGFNPNTLHNPTGGYGDVLTINNAVNIPDNVYGSWITQIAANASGGYLGVRNRSNGGAWSSWARILTEDHAVPTVTNTFDLGSSTLKWKTLNGINPGALSLPDYNNALDVTSEIPVASLDGNTQIDINDYLPNKTGWLSIVIADTASNFIVATQGRSGGSTAYNNSRTVHTGAQSNGYISVFFPILANMNKFVSIKASSLIQMRFYYCLGNV